MAHSWRTVTCHTQHRCSLGSSAPAPRAGLVAFAHVRQRRGWAALWMCSSQAPAVRGARSVCSAAVEAGAAVAAAPVERERVLDDSPSETSDPGACPAVLAAQLGTLQFYQ